VVTTQASAATVWGAFVAPQRSSRVTRLAPTSAPRVPLAPHAARRAMMATVDVSYISADELAELLQGCACLHGKEARGSESSRRKTRPTAVRAAF
jgi:hypothetical protein